MTFYDATNRVALLAERTAETNKTQLHSTYCVRSVNAALVILDGKCKPLIISCHNFLLITSTRPPRAITKLYNSYKSSTDLAMIGSRLIGVPEMRRMISAN